jgi:DNA-binding transcriptional MerR regulator
MAPVATEDFPYTAKYVRELLKLDDHDMMAYAEALSISPRADEQAGGVVFSAKDVELIRKAMALTTQGETLSAVAQVLGRASEETALSRPTGPSAAGRKMAAVAGGANVSQIKPSKDNLALVVEAVSQAKESILKDLSRLLDDKLAGLDEVVVELIRCKSENDSLKHQLQKAVQEKEAIQRELGKFKPVQFGFFRKAD